MDPAERSALLKRIQYLLANEPEKVHAAGRSLVRRAYALAEQGK